MTMVSLSPGLMFGPHGMHRRSEYRASSPSHQALDGAKHGEAQCVRFLESGKIITKVAINVYSRIGTPPAYNVGIQTVSGDDPTGNPYGGGAMEAYNFATANLHIITLSTPPTTTRGDKAAIVVESGATPPDGSNYIKACIVNYDNWLSDYTMARYRIGGSWGTTLGGQGQAGAAPSVPGMLALHAVRNYFVDYGATGGVEWGNKIIMPFNARARGIWTYNKRHGGGYWRTYLVDSGLSVLFQAGSHFEKITSPNNGDFFCLFPSPITLVKNETYYITTSCASLSYYASYPDMGVDVANGDHRYSHPWARYCTLVNRAGYSGAYTEYDGRFTLAGFILDQIDMEDV